MLVPMAIYRWKTPRPCDWLSSAAVGVMVRSDEQALVSAAAIAHVAIQDERGNMVVSSQVEGLAATPFVFARRTRIARPGHSAVTRESSSSGATHYRVVKSTSPSVPPLSFLAYSSPHHFWRSSAFA